MNKNQLVPIKDPQIILKLNIDNSGLIMDVKHALSEYVERLEMIGERESSQEIFELSEKFDEFCSQFEFTEP